MNAAEFAKAVAAAKTILKLQAASGNPRVREGGTVGLLCRAVLDAEAYRARVEAVATEMRVTGESARPFGSGHLRDWAAQLTENGNG